MPTTVRRHSRAQPDQRHDRTLSGRRSSQVSTVHWRFGILSARLTIRLARRP